MKRGPWISFVDALMLIVLFLFLLPMKPDVSAADDSRSGMVVIEAHWPDRSLADVDLWVLTPGDSPVGYSRLRGSTASLFRDDLGNDASPWRYEITATREVPDGEYVANVHLYSDRAREAPIAVQVSCWFRTAYGSKTVVWSGSVVLSSPMAEVTAVRWRMLNGAMVPGSIHHSPIRIRTGVPAP